MTTEPKDDTNIVEGIPDTPLNVMRAVVGVAAASEDASGDVERDE